jgi:enoyl-CoA hydratase/carnithine racemase
LRALAAAVGGARASITLVGPARAKRITLLCEKMDAATARAWGLVDAVAEDGKTVEVALEMARRTAEMSPVTVRLMKEAINATAGALHRATSFADGDQSQLASGFEAARQRFGKR